MKLLWVLVILIFFLHSPLKISAESNYVLPYPSFMPGNPLYKVNLIKDEILKFWYFGSFGQFKYNLKQADKYLVEAKTLFEYKQYLLGFEALEKSDEYFKSSGVFLNEAKKENKNINDNLLILKNAGNKHVEVLSKLRNEVPESFTWQPEKEKPTLLNLREEIETSISIRKKYL